MMHAQLGVVSARTLKVFPNILPHECVAVVAPKYEFLRIAEFVFDQSRHILVVSRVVHTHYFCLSYPVVDSALSFGAREQFQLAASRHRSRSATN